MRRCRSRLLLFTVALFINTEVWQVAASLDGLLFWTTVLFFVVAGSPLPAAAPAGVESRRGKLRDQLTGGTWSRLCDSPRITDGGRRRGARRTIASRGPWSPSSTGRRQQGNVLLVLFFSQAVQVLLVSVAISVFFFVFGLVAIRPEVIAAWLGDIGSDTLATVGRCSAGRSTLHQTVP